jgi:hypothetical protein
MASSTPHTIMLATNDDITRPIEEYVVDTGDTIKPGMLVRVKADDGDVEVHGTAGGNAEPIFALENPWATNFTQPAIDTTYAAGDLCFTSRCQTGDVVYAWLDQGENVGIGDPLESAGNGYLQEHVPPAISGTGPNTFYYSSLVAIAKEAVNASGAPTRIRVVVA